MNHAYNLVNNIFVGVLEFKDEVDEVVCIEVICHVSESLKGHWLVNEVCQGLKIGSSRLLSGLLKVHTL